MYKSILDASETPEVVSAIRRPKLLAELTATFLIALLIGCAGTSSNDSNTNESYTDESSLPPATATPTKRIDNFPGQPTQGDQKYLTP